MIFTTKRHSSAASDEKRIGSTDFIDDTRTPKNTSANPNDANDLPDPDAGLSAAERAANDRALLWKLDLKLIPWLSFLYLTSFLDRTNIGNAKIDGLQQDLHMSNQQYNNSLTIFFVSYACFEPLTNILLKRLRPSVFLPIIMVWWGICMTSMGLVHSKCRGEKCVET